MRFGDYSDDVHLSVLAGGLYSPSDSSLVLVVVFFSMVVSVIFHFSHIVSRIVYFI